MSNICYLKRQEIDDRRWDQCIKDAGNGLIYARTYFMDIMAGDWDGMILNDYEAVMPIARRKKLGISYIYQPFFVPQLGVFGNRLLPEQVLSFLKNIPQKFRYMDFDLNQENQLNAGDLGSKFVVFPRVNYYLLPSSDQMLNRYHRLARRMLQQAHEANVKITRQADPQKIISFYGEQYAHRHPEIDAGALNRLARVAKIAQASDQCHLYEAMINDTTVAVYLVLSDERNFYSVLGGSSDQGRNSGAFYALTDAAIRDAGSLGKLFRFEGSDIPGIASFNAQFGSIKTNYPHIKFNNLPLIIRWMK